MGEETVGEEIKMYKFPVPKLMSHGYKMCSVGEVVKNYVTYFGDIIRFILLW